MVEAADLQPLGEDLWLWQAYDPTVKSDLFSSAAKIGDRLFLVDPIPLATPALSELTSNGEVFAVIVTNANHMRAAVAFARRFDVPIVASAAVLGEVRETKTIAAADAIDAGFATLAIEGGAAGEIALHFGNGGGTIVLGDALINFEPYGFALLPAKYCTQQKLMRQSLRRLLDFQFDRLLFAHGMPIVSSARARLEALLAA